MSWQTLNAGSRSSRICLDPLVENPPPSLKTKVESFRDVSRVGLLRALVRRVNKKTTFALLALRCVGKVSVVYASD